MPPEPIHPGAVVLALHRMGGALTVIRGNAQLAAIEVSRMGVTDEQQDRLLRYLSAIDQAVDVVCEEVGDLRGLTEPE